MTYFLDTNSIRILEQYYPERFPSFWRAFDAAVAQGVIASVREVGKEVEQGAAAPHLIEWCSRHPGFFREPDDAVLQAVRQIFMVTHFQGMVGEKQLLAGSPVADPFLVAAAMVAPGTVVTQERFKPNSAKIPTVCSHFEVACMSLADMLAELDWAF